MLKMGSIVTEKKLEVVFVAPLALCFFSSAVCIPQDNFTVRTIRSCVDICPFSHLRNP